MPKQHHPSRPGSIYLITLLTVAGIVSMVLIGVLLRSASNTQSTLIEQMSADDMGTLDTSEIAFEQLTTDPIWRVSAQTGNVFGPKGVSNGNTMASTAVDASTGLAPTYDTTTYRLTMSSLKDTPVNSSKVDVLATQYDYLTYLRTLPIKNYWPLNEHSNPVQAMDPKGGYTGTYQSPAVAGASYNDEGGPVPVFATTSDEVQIPWGKKFKLSDGSVSLWMRCTGNTRAESYSFLGMQYDLGGLPTLSMSVYLYGVTAYVDQDNLYSSANFTMTATDLITPGVWYHIVFTWGVKGMHIYIDGVEKANKSTNTDGLKTANLSQGGHQPLHLGDGYYTGIPSTPEDAFAGSIAHVAFFDKQLTAGEVAALAAIKPSLRTYSIVANTWQRLYDQ